MDGLQSLAQASHRLSLFRLQGLFPQFGHGRRRSQARQANKNAAPEAGAAFDPFDGPRGA
jgi:hypothetical protein